MSELLRLCLLVQQRWTTKMGYYIKIFRNRYKEDIWPEGAELRDWYFKS